MRLHTTWRVLFLTVFALIALTSTVSAQPIELYTDIHSPSSALCTGVAGNPLTDGANIIQTPCASTAAQSWYLRPYGGQSQIILQGSGQCLSSSGGSSGASVPIVQTSCLNNTSGKWLVKPVAGGFQITNYAGGLCLTGSGANGATLTQLACAANPSPAQTWAFSTAPVGMTIFSNLTGKCLDANGGTVQNSCSSASTQQWSVVPYGNSYHLIVPATGNCLGVDPNHAGAGLPFTQAPCRTDNSSYDWGDRWYLYVRGSTFNIANGIYPWCLEMDSTSDGGTAVMNNCTSNQNQLWSIRTPASLSPDIAGQWGPVITLPLVPVAVAMLPTGKVLMWSADDTMSETGPNPNSTYTALFDPATGNASLSFIVSTNHNMFCPGTSNLPDGRIFINGGATNPATTIYDPFADTWTADKLMNIGRGYEGDTLMPTGNVFTIGGSWPSSSGGKTGEMWNSGTGWTLLSGIPDDPIIGPDPAGPNRGDNHVWLFATGPNMVFHAGPSAAMHWFNTSATGSYTSAGNRGDDPYSINGIAAMVGPGKIFKTGGAPAYDAANATSNTYTIDITNGVTVTKRIPMMYPRGFASGVVLPTGDVLVSGGQTLVASFTDTLPVMSPELWSYKTATFSELAPETVPRTYHSIALLMPDARILIGGGGLCIGPCNVNHPDVQFFTPPYLLNADGSLKPRISILSAPTTASHGSNITVRTSGPAPNFALVRMSSITHTINNDQRRIAIVPTQIGTNTYSLTIPPGTASVLAGYYMLFALDAQNVPSVASTLQILQ